ncbi:undecaprenyl-diphosphate phosphatase [Cytophagales bacterium LB-30]|uniref:Undecaprenyl-diphosphatase n=1 Tax=Shiella aurantiaca TaxID=3058365 RepID=A0ABT8F4E9_9BACT|nr:undecaprenyl-diphosphate phosphatase [Shiella aurantiaca]MDN4165317.1 undecaprenyl-diphosphate phosphatase [Shiella aurantiaca]
MSFWEAFVLAVVEGLTEFLPVSSTGHMIIASYFMGINQSDFVKIFNVNIQFGAILSVVVLYWKRFFQSLTFYYKLFIAFIPAAVFGLLLNDYIDALLENVVVVAISLILGGIVLLFIDRYFNKNTLEVDEMSYKKAFYIGFFQCIAMIPGVSRSAATIIGGMSTQLSRKAAAEFSFFLAVPTMFAAASYKLLKGYDTITADHISTLLIGNLIAFLVALAAIKFFISYVTKYGFKVFGIYRIIVGIIILLIVLSGGQLSL